MKALFIILNDFNTFDKLLVEMEKNKFRGTIFDTRGMAQEMSDQDNTFSHDYLRKILKNNTKSNKTLLSIVKSDAEAEQIKAIVRKISGGLDSENTGIMFTIPVENIEGIII